MSVIFGLDWRQGDGVYGVHPVCAEVTPVVERGAVGRYGQVGIALVEQHAHEDVVCSSLAEEGHMMRYVR